LLTGTILGVYFAQPRHDVALLINPTSGRGREIKIMKQDAVNAFGEGLGNSPPQHFIKIHDAYNIARKGFLKLQHYALWLAREGTAYVYNFEGSKEEISFSKAVKHFLGDLYEKLPQDIKAKIEENKIAVTVEFPSGPLTPVNPYYDPKQPEGPENQKFLKSVSNDDLERNNDERAMRIYWEEAVKEEKKSYFNLLIACLAGGGIFSVIYLFTGHLR
jgi:hypothetical protein